MMAIVKLKSRYSVPMSLWLVEKNQRSTKLCLWPWSSWTWELSAAAGYVDMCCLPRVCLSVTASCCCGGPDDRSAEIGRESCRERGCQYVSISVVAGSFKTKKK